MDTKSVWSMHLIEQKSEFVLQKSTNSGSSYTNIKKAKNNLSETVYLNQNDLIRITSDTTNKLTFNQGELNNSFGAHLLNSGNSTSPIPIYGFFVEKNGAQTSLSDHGTIVNWHKVSNQHFILPEANFDLTNGIYTIPVSGYYNITAHVRFNSSDSNRVYLSVNDSTVSDNVTISSYQTTTNENSYVISGVLKLQINDTIRIKVLRSDSNILGGDSEHDTHWSCFLLASDTQTNTRQMGLSPIVPLHQLGHDQF